MPFIRLNYKFHSHGLLPLCEVIILGRDRRVPIRAVVDSGASIPIFPESAAADAGLVLSRAQPWNITFGGSTTRGKLLETHIEISGHRLRTEIAFVERMSLDYALLGRRTVFNQFKEVAFIEKVASPRVELRL